MGSPAKFVTTQRAVAAAIGVDRHTIKEWLAEGAPGKTSKGYDIAAIVQWRDLNKRQYGDDWRDIEGISEDEYKARMSIARLRKAEGEALKYESEARIKEHEAQKTTEDVVHLDDVERFMAGVFAETRRLLERLPMEMKNGYPEEIRDALAQDLEARLSIVLRTMSGYCRRLVDLRDE